MKFFLQALVIVLFYIGSIQLTYSADDHKKESKTKSTETSKVFLEIQKMVDNAN